MNTLIVKLEAITHYFVIFQGKLTMITYRSGKANWNKGVPYSLDLTEDNPVNSTLIIMFDGISEQCKIIAKRKIKLDGSQPIGERIIRNRETSKYSEMYLKYLADNLKHEIGVN